MKYPSFVGGSYTLDTVNADLQQTLNLMATKVESGAGKNNVILEPVPGLSLKATLPKSPIRGMFSGGSPLNNSDRLFVAAGNGVYEVFTDYTYSEVGSCFDDGTHSPVKFYPNGNQLWVVSSGETFLLDGAATGTWDDSAQPNFTETYTDLVIGTDPQSVSMAVPGHPEIKFGPADVGKVLDVTGGTGFTTGRHYIFAVDPDGVAYVDPPMGTAGSTGGTAVVPVRANTGAFLDSYFLADYPQSRTFYYSTPNDGNTWSMGDFAVKEAYPDHIGALLADHEDLWIFGESTTEVWRDVGDVNTPFQRDPGAFIHQGIAAMFSAVHLENGVAWLGTDTRGGPVAWRAQGFQPVRVSTHAIEQTWKGYSTFKDAESFTYRFDGHELWCLRFPTAGKTWVYDTSTGLWHERGSWTGTANGQWKVRCQAFVWSKHLVGAGDSGKIYEMSSAYEDEDGTPIHWSRTAPHLADEEERLFYHSFQLDMETGRLASAPNVSLEWSNDRGHTWQTPRTITAGASGQYKFRVIWRRLGSARDRAYRASGAGRFALINAILSATKGNA